MYKKLSNKMTGGVQKAVQGGDQGGRTGAFGATWVPFGRFGVPFWRPLDFEGVPNPQLLYNIDINYQKSGDQEQCLTKHEIVMES